MAGPAIELHQAGKRYTKYDDTPMLLTSALRLGRRTRRQKLWAIRGVDLSVPPGHTYGIVGRNGSGKTTLLSLIGGVTAPSEGSVRVVGRIAPLISVGVGFHRELTGRENVFLNGTILGLTRRQIEARLDDIVAFAEIPGFLDTPVKFYSSGMYVRLGFAVAVHSDPEVLLVDEVLAVGDLGFQMKCYERMEELKSRGTTVVVVSHNLGAMQRMCDRILVVHRGSPVGLDEPARAIAHFHELLESETELQVDRASGLRHEPGVVRLTGLEVLDEAGLSVGQVLHGTPVRVRLTADVDKDLDDVVVGFTFTGPEGQTVYTDTTANRSLGPAAAGSRLAVGMGVVANLPTGSYTVSAWVQRADLRTLLARSRPVPFFVSGRVTVSGAADLGGTIEREDALVSELVAEPGA